MKSYKNIFFIGLVLVLLAPGFLLVHAAGEGTNTTDPPKIDNPLGDVNDLGALIFKIAEEVAKIGFYVVVIFIIYSGFLFVKARGSEKELETAKKTFLYTVIGAAILLGATVFARVIEGTVNQLKDDPPAQQKTL